MAKVKSPYGFCTTLDGKFEPADRCVELTDHADRLCAELAQPECYTYLVICDAYDYEIVRVTCTDGKLYFERGAQDSTARQWCRGTTIKFEVTGQLSADLLACAQEEAGETGYKSDTLTVGPDEDDPDCIRIELSEKLEADTVLCVAGRAYTFDKYGRLCKDEADSQIGVVPDGKFTNATVCYEKGKLTSVTSGSPVVANGSKCCCKSCTCTDDEPVEP